MIRMPLAPAATRLSMASICASLSPSYLPAKVRNSTPISSALAFAPSRIFTKKGLVLVLVIRPMMASSAMAGAARPVMATKLAAVRI